MGTDMRLPATLQAPHLARQAVEEALGGSLPADTLEDVKLLTSELVTNSVKYADLGPNSWIGLTIGSTVDAVRVGVSDPGPGFDAPAQPVARPQS
ncbi:MAG: ATP-binding protein, partial [Pseudonocardiaceae bacterium]